VNYGLSDGARVVDAKTQEKSLQMLGELTQRAILTPTIRNTALRIIGSAGCNSREDRCELDAVFSAVKDGDPNVRPFHNGFKYVADPRFADYFASPTDIVNNCAKGACGGDCDEHAALIAALLGSIGWKVGLRAYGIAGTGGYSHVYAVVAFPKKPKQIGTGKFAWEKVLALDTTVPSSRVSWEPPKGNVLTAWLE
jgi:hypothetical protein